MITVLNGLSQRWHIAKNNHKNFRGGLKTTLKGSIYSRTSFLACHSGWEGAPRYHMKSRWKRALRNTGEWQVISEAWLWITYTLHTKGQPLHQYNFTRKSSHLFKSPRAPSSQLLLNSQHNESTLPSSLQPNSTQPNSTIYSSHTHSTPYPVSVPSQSSPLSH